MRGLINTLRVVFLLICAVSAPGYADSEKNKIDSVVSAGVQEYNRGQFQQAISLWSEALEHYNKSSAFLKISQIKSRIAGAYQSMGQITLAIYTLE